MLKCSACPEELGMDDFEQAIVVVFSQAQEVTPAVREQAGALTESVKNRPDAYDFCWTQFIQKDRLEVKFWCLQTITQAIPALSFECRLDLRRKVLAWLQEAAATNREDVAIQNKIALVYVSLMRLDYPTAWPTAWQDLIALLDQGRNIVEIFVRIQSIFDQEVVSDEVPRDNEERQCSQIIKKAMRESGDVLRVAECWYTILFTFPQIAPTLVVECLKAISVFVVWVDVGTVAN